MSWSAAGAVSMASFGETLKRERELREISLRQISEATKINIRYLEALEENRFEALPGGLFNKGFIRAFATFIGIDGEAMVNSYLHELSERQQGNDASSSRGPTNLHRPAEVPQRRAPPSGGATTVDRGSGGTIALVAPTGGAPDGHAATTPTVTVPARVQAAGRARSAAQTHDRAAAEALHPAVTGIELADRAGPAPSRVLAWVLSLVAVTGLLFMIVALARRPGTGPGHPPDQNAAPGASAPASPQGGGTAQPPGDGEPATGDPSAVLPEVSSQSPLTLSAIAAPPARPLPSATQARADAKPAAGTAAPSSRTETRPGPDQAEENARPRDSGASTGPMKVEVEATGRTYVVLACDGREVLSRFMDAGETERARCDSVVRVSATDAGAVRLAVNGSGCLPLGDPGTRVFGYTVRIDDFARICPAPERGGDGRP